MYRSRSVCTGLAADRYVDRPLPGGTAKRRLSMVDFDRRRSMEEKSRREEEEEEEEEEGGEANEKRYLELSSPASRRRPRRHHHCPWVEGMAPVFSRAAWQCVWHLIQVQL
ncbi:hypothetical protein GW17_00003910 [Ensete ventricosum]|nr:hypothetical protein GW17_00003910 [Ensete ventricosum]